MYKIYRPSGILSKYIKFYWISKNFEDSYCESKFRVIPNGLFELLINLGERYHCINENQKLEFEPLNIICGQKTSFFDIVPAKNTHLFSIVFKPAGLAAFFPFSFNEIKNISIDLDSVMKANNLFSEQIRDARNDEERIIFIESFLIQKLKPEKRKHIDTMENIITYLNKAPETITIENISYDFNLNYKFIERLFQRNIGISPIKYIKIIRFQKAIHKYSIHKPDLTTLAQDCGYFDQSHFNKDSKLFTGMPPGEFFKNKYLQSDYFLN